MTVKLNLTVNEETAMAIKKFAQRKKTSVSRIAEELFRKELQEETRKRKALTFFNKYAGTADTGNEDDYKERLLKAIEAKHHDA